MHEYERAIADYDHALTLDPNLTQAYNNRGIAYLLVNNMQQAASDFSVAYQLDQNDLSAGWMALWTAMGKEPLSAEALARLAHIAESETINDDQRYIAHICKGVVWGHRGRLKEGLAALEEAILLKKDEYDAYFWKGMLGAYYYRGQSHEQEVIEAIEQALKNMPPCLLRPLYWLERDRLEFFARYARPLLEKYGV